MVKRFVPDTNFFLQARVPGELPWRDITDADAIELVVVDAVIAELDAHKGKGNSRTARRARSTFELLDRLFDDPGEDEVVVRGASPRVVVRLAPALAPNRDKSDQLDLTTADGRIVEQALAVRDVLDGELTLLSHDRMPRRAAKLVGLTSCRLPDTWLLSPEPDERDVELAKAKEELKALKNRGPNIAMEVQVQNKPVKRIEGPLVRYRPHSPEYIAEAMEVLEQRHPEKTKGIAGQFTMSLQIDREHYLEKRREWLEKVESIIDRHPQVLTFQEGMFPVDVVLHNVGTAPAEGLLVEVSVEGPLRLVNPRRYEELISNIRFALPAPPEVPSASSSFVEHLRAGRAESLGRLTTLPHFPQPHSARDPMRFYWDYGDQVVTDELSGSCDDFRHQVGYECVPLLLFLPSDEEGEPVGCLRVRYSAKNLPGTVLAVFPIRLELKWGDSEGATKSLLMGA